MAELNAGVNKFTVDAAGDNGKIAFTTTAPNGTGFAESTHHFAKTADDMGVFVYTNDVTSIKIWQKINGSWLDCGSTGGQLGFPWHASFAWRDGATHMHVQLDGPNMAGESIRIIKIEGNMFASFDGTTQNSVLLLNDSVVEDTDDDGDIEVTSGVGYNVFLAPKDRSWLADTSPSFNIPNEIDMGIFIKNDTEVISFTNTWDGAKNVITFDLEETPGRDDQFVLYYREPQSYSGNVSDGAISGATVTDVATGETTSTDSNGDFSFASMPTGDIEAEGGVDVVTGDAYVGKMKGNSKYTIISPLSTAAIEVAEDQGITFDQAVDDILDNSAALFGIDFPKEDRLELLNKRFVDEAAKGNSKAVRGSALIAMIDASAELVGESLTHMTDAAAGDLATDAVDGKKQAYRGIARLVQDAKALSDTEREELSTPLGIDVGRVSQAVAIRKGAGRKGQITLKNERNAEYGTGITDLLKSRSNEMSEALSSKYEENYAITRIQSIAKTTKNEDKTSLEGFKGLEGESLTLAVVDNSKLNQIGDVPNKVVEEVKYMHTAIGEFDSLSFTYGSDTVDFLTVRGKNALSLYTYFKELETGTQLYYGTKGNDNAELDLTTLDLMYDVRELKVPMSKAKTMTFEVGGFKYTVNYNGIVVLKEQQEEKKPESPKTHLFESGGLYSVKYSNSSGGSLTWPNQKDLGYPQPTVVSGILSFGDHQLRSNALKSGSFEFKHRNWKDYGIDEWMAVDGFDAETNRLQFSVNIGKATETYIITWEPTSTEGNKLTTWEEATIYGATPTPRGVVWLEHETYTLKASALEHRERGKSYLFETSPSQFEQMTTYAVYANDMDNVYATSMKVETQIPITWSGSEALFKLDSKSALDSDTKIA